MNNITKNLVIYNTSTVVGGHEILAIEAIKMLSERPNYHLTVFCSSKNKQMLSELYSIDGICVREMQWYSGRLQFISSFFNCRVKRHLKDILRQCNPDAILVIQGNIEISSEMLVAAKELDIKTISYIPLAFWLKEKSSHHIIGMMKDIINLRLFSLPTYFITVNDEQRNLIISRGVNREKVMIVKNGIHFARHSLNAVNSQIDSIINNSGSKYVFGVIGRVEFLHKGQDILIKAIALNRARFQDSLILVAGDGKDRLKLAKYIKKNRLNDIVKLVGNVSPQEFYKSVDTVIIPSVFEGSPLVMYEALASGCKVCGSDLLCIRDVIGTDYTFPINDAAKMVEVIIRTRYDEAYPDLSEYVSKMYSIDKFGNSFIETLDYLINGMEVK